MSHAASGAGAADLSSVLQTDSTYMSVRQVAHYLQLNEKKIYALVNDGKIPATKVTGKWMFPRELVDRWMMDSSHGGLMTDQLVIAGSDDPLLYRIVLQFASDMQSKALMNYTATGTRLGLELLDSQRVDACAIHWGPAVESHIRHPALLQQYVQHHSWVLIRAFRREQGLMVAPLLGELEAPEQLLAGDYRWAMRQSGAGAQRYLLEVLARRNLSLEKLNTSVSALSEREAAAFVAMGLADVAPGARSTANEFGLGFLSLGWEAVDFVLPRRIWFRRLFQTLIERLKAAPARQLAELLGGYDLDDSGTLIWGDE